MQAERTAATPAEVAAMERAVELAARGPARDANPRVGCVLLDGAGATLAEGWHEGAGNPHAEAVALAAARSAGVTTAGATAVVTLEPCHHTGRTPPCTRALLEAGVRRVVFAAADPDPVAGGGADFLRDAGVDVVAGVLAERSEELLRVWATNVRHQRPYVTLKTALTLDGRVAAADGSSRWITSAEARTHAHRTRAEVDAIAVGTGTALRDDPELTARADGAPLARQPLRVVVGSRPLPARSRLLGTQHLGPVLQLPGHDVPQVLADLAAREVRHLLVEGGPTLATAFLRAGVVDEVHAYVAPVLLGSGPSGVGDLGITRIDHALRLEVHDRIAFGRADTLLVLRRPPVGTDPHPSKEH